MKDKRPRVLVVEQASGLAKTWVQKFGDRGFTVTAAESPEAALKMASEKHPDIIVVDLPETHEAAIKKIRKNKWAESLPFLFLNNCKDEEMFTGRLVGQDEYMPYNWSLEGVVQKVGKKLMSSPAFERRQVYA